MEYILVIQYKMFIFHLILDCDVCMLKTVHCSQELTVCLINTMQLLFRILCATVLSGDCMYIDAVLLSVWKGL